MDKESWLTEISPSGHLGERLYTFLRAVAPMSCVDIVLVPESQKPQVILLYRENSKTVPNQYWVAGGRVRKNETLENAAKRLTREETNLDITIKEEDQLFTDQTFLEGNVHTISTVYIARTPSIAQIKDIIRIASGNTHYKVFDAIQENWHPYVQKAVRKAWERILNV